MPSIISMPPNGMVSGPLPNALPQAVAQAMGAAGAETVAQALLPQAVAASPSIPTYQADALRQLKLASKTNAPSSALAAQFIAQTPQPSDEELAIFEPRATGAPPTSAPANQPPAFFPAANDIPPELGGAQGAGAAPALTLVANATTASATTMASLPGAAVATASAATWGVKTEPAALAAPTMGKKPVPVRGAAASAYQATHRRNEENLVQANAAASF